MPFLYLTEAYLIILLYHMFAALQKPESVSNVGSETDLKLQQGKDGGPRKGLFII